MANFPTIGLGQAGQNAFNNKWAGYTPPAPAPAPIPTAQTQQPVAPKPPTTPVVPTVQNQQQGSTVIPVQTIGSQQPINIPTQQQPVTMPNAPINYADQLMQQANADSQNTQVQDYQNTSIMQMLDAYNNLAGESAYRTQAIQDSNINGLKQNLQNINNQILTKQAEIQQDDVRLAAGLNNIEKKAIPMEFITGQQQSVQRDAQIARALKMSEIGVLNAQVLAGQGNIELAQKTVEEAVAAKYAPFKEIIDINKQQLEAIAPLLSKAEAKQAAAQQVKVSLAMKEIDKVSDFQKQVLNNAISRNAPQSVLNAINKGQSIEEITKAGAGYLKSESDILDAQLKQLQMANISANTAKTRSEMSGSGKLSADEKKATKASKNLVGLLDIYEKEITGLSFFTANSPAKITALNSLKGRITAEYKQAKQLGTLDTGVQKLIDQIIPNPGDLSVSSLDNAAQVKAIQDFKKDFMSADDSSDPTEAYFNASSTIVSSPNGSSKTTSFIEEYNNRAKQKTK